MTIKQFLLDRIEPNPFQVRLAEDLEHVAKVALSIAHSGLLQTPVGRAHPADGDDVAQLAFGHTRLAAYRRLRDEDIAAGGTGGEWLSLPVDEESEEARHEMEFENERALPADLDKYSRAGGFPIEEHGERSEGDGSHSEADS